MNAKARKLSISKNSTFRIFALESSCEIFEKSTNFCSSATQKQQKLKATISSLSFSFDLYDLLRDIDLFDSSLKHSDSNLKQFNETSNFLRNLQHCQHLYRYRKTHLLLFLLNCLNDSIFKWFQKQSHFDNLHIFSTILTNVFSSQQQRRKARVRKRANRKVAKKIVKDAKSTSKLQNIDIFDSTSCNESKFELYSEVANFLQSLQQCQHQYRKSDLLNLLSKCLCDFAFEWFKTQSEFISLKRINRTLAKTFSKVSLRRVSSRSSNLQLCTLVAISKSMKNASNQQVVQMICKICKQSFNFNKKLYEHIRNHEALKLVKNSSLSINAVNLVCEIEKKSFVTHVSSASSARSQNSIFESATAFRSVTLLKRSILSSFTLDVVSIRMKNESLQCSSISSQNSIQDDVEIDTQKSSAISSSLLISTTNFTCKITERPATCRHCKQTFKFKELLRKHKREQHAKKFVISSSLLSHALNSMCEAEKKSAIACSSSSQKSSIFSATSRSLVTDTRISLQLVSSKFSSLSIATSKITSKDTKITSNSRIVCARAICKRCKQNFNFNNKLHEHIRQHHARKSVKNSDFRVSTFESAYKIAKKSTIICSLTSQFASSILFATSRNQIFESETFFKTIISSKRSSFTLATNKNTSKSMKKLLVNCSLTSSLSFFRISVRNFHEFHIRKSHLIVNDLSRMFHEKFKSFDLRQHHNRRLSSQSLDIRQSHFSSSLIKFHLIIENLFEMFDEKFKRESLFQSQKNVFFFENSSQIKRELRSTSSLQSIRSRQLIETQKAQNRRVWINTCLRNSFALLSAKILLRNRTIYYTNCQISSTAKTCLRNQSIYYTNCSMFFASIWNLLSKLFSSFSYFFVFSRSFFLLSHSFRSFQLQEWIALTFMNKSFRSLIVSFNKITNLLLRNETEKRQRVKCSNI